MDRLRTVLLARSHVVVLDPELVAAAATRPLRDADVDKLEAALARHGFVMSLDLAITMRRLPNQALQELRDWIEATLAVARGDDRAPYLQRIAPWLVGGRDQPCPWCGQLRALGALDPCGHLVCEACWTAGRFVGCPVCHRRVVAGEPFAALPADTPRSDGTLALVHLGLDLTAAARARFEQLVARVAPLSDDDRGELVAIVDAVGPRAAAWLPARIAVRETAALAIARLMLGAPDPSEIARIAARQLATAADVLRVAHVLLGDRRLGSLRRPLRRALLEALDRLPADALAVDVAARRAAWRAVGERLHPFEFAARLPNAALAFAIARGTSLAQLAFADTLRLAAAAARVTVVDDRLHAPDHAAVEAALRAGDALAALALLAARPDELLRRAAHLTRIAKPDARAALAAALAAALPHGAAPTLLALARHRGVGSLAELARAELAARAAARRHFPRALLDRALADANAALWQVACIHAAARANVVYVREPDGAVAVYRRRDGEPASARLARLASAADADGQLAEVPPAAAPPWLPGDDPRPLVDELAPR